MKYYEVAAMLVALVCVLGAADAWFNTGVVGWLVDLWLSDPPNTPADVPPMLIETPHHWGHALLWLIGAFSALSLALAFEFIEGFFQTRSTPEIQRRRMIATLLHVARAAGPIEQSTIDNAFLKTTGEALGPREAASAYRSCFLRGNAPTLEQVLSGLNHPDERRALVKGATAVWLETGIDSAEATLRLEQVTTCLGLNPDQVAELLDPDTDTPRVFRELRRTTSSCLTFVARSVSALN